MDRVAQLARSADIQILVESMMARQGRDSERLRATVRESLAERARSLGFPESEIPSAIDTALGGR